MTKPPIRNKTQVHTNRAPSPPSEASLADLSWLPTALHSLPGVPELPDSLEQPEIIPELSPELSTPIADSTPIQDTWNILDESGATEEISLDLQAC